MDDKFIERILQLLKAERLPVDDISFELQDDGDFVLASIKANDLLSVTAGKRIAAIMDRNVPKRRDDDAWMVVVMRGESVVDSFSGGKLASPIAS